LLNLWQFDGLLEARVIDEDWHIDFNINRRHTVHDELSPAEFAAHPTTPTPIRIATGPLRGASQESNGYRLKWLLNPDTVLLRKES